MCLEPRTRVWSRQWAVRTAWLATSIWAVLALFIPLALHAVPRVRGLEFPIGLRFWPTTIASAALAATAAGLYTCIWERRRYTTRSLLVVVTGAATVLFAAMAENDMAAALPAIAAVPLGGALVLNRRANNPPSTGRVLAILLLGVTELVALAMGLASERRVPDSEASLISVRQLLGVESRFIDLDGGARVHYVDEGRGPVLLFLHGNPAWLFQWRELIWGLRDSYRCVALDYPGFGLSSAPADFHYTPREQRKIVEDFVNRLDLRDVTLVMHDWGGPIGLGFATSRPQLIQRVILGNTWAWPTPRTVPRGLFSVIAGGPIGEFLQVNFNGIVHAALAGGSMPERVRDGYGLPFGPVGRRGIAAFYPGQITAAAGYMRELAQGLAPLADRPALIVWGTRDPGFPRDDLERFQRAFPQHLTIEYEDADHFVFEDVAKQLIPKIRAFLDDN